MENLSAICCLLIILFGCSIHVTSTAEIGCEYDEIRFMRNGTDFLVDCDIEKEVQNRTVQLSLTFNITRVIFGIVNFKKALQSVVFNNNSTTEKFFKDKKDLYIFDESFLTESLVIECDNSPDSSKWFTQSINMILLGCDEFYEYGSGSTITTTITTHVTTTHTITVSTSVTSTSACHKTTYILSATIPTSVMETMVNQTSTTASASESCQDVIYAAVIPVVVMLLLNIIALGTLVFFLVNNKGKKKDNRLKRGSRTLREVPNESLYEMSSTEDKKDKEESLYSPVFEGPIVLGSPPGSESDYIEPRPLKNVAKRRPGSLPINSFAGRLYSEVTPYHSNTSLPALPRMKSNQQLIINEYKEEEGAKNQLYQIVGSPSPVKGMERETGQSVVDSN